MSTSSVSAGGSISFLALPNGAVIVDGWSVRVPLLEAAQVSATGGLVLSARWNDGTVWDRKLTQLVGRVLDEESGHPMSGVRVTLGAGSDETESDSAGRFVFRPILPGQYTVAAIDSALSALSTPRAVTRSVTVAAGKTDVPVELRVPSRRTLVARACGEGGAALAFSARFITEAVHVGEDGMFYFCGIPRRRAIRLMFTIGGVAYADTVLRVVDGESSASLEWQLPLASRESATFGDLTLSGSVKSAGTDRPVVGAGVWLPALELHATTDSAGVFRLPGLPAGRYLIQIRKIGFLARRDTASATTGGAMRDYIMSASPTELDTIHTISSQVKYRSPALRRFEERRSMGMGYFIAEADLRAQNDKGLSQILASRVSGISLVPGTGGATYAVSSRKMCPGRALSGCSRPSCFVSVVLDGISTYSAMHPTAPPPDLSRIRVSDLAGVEFYPSGGSGPPEFNITDSGCGTLFLWTRER